MPAALSLRATVAAATLALAFLALATAPAAARAADEPEDGAKAGDTAAAPKTPRAPLPWEVRKSDEDGCRPEEIALLRELAERARQLDARESALAAREAAAVAVEATLGKELARVDGLRAELLTLLGRVEATSDENVASLAKMVDSMKPKEAAPMLAGMDDDVALEVLTAIKPKQAAKILGAMPAVKAQALGDRFTLVPDPRSTLDDEEADDAEDDASGDAAGDASGAANEGAR